MESRMLCRQIHMFAKILAVGLLLVASTSAPAQGIAMKNVTEMVSVSHGSDWVGDKIIVTGEIQNKTNQTYPCLMLVFHLLESQGGSLKIVGQDAITVRGIGPKQIMAYRGKLKTANAITHASTMTCADPVAKKTSKRCHISGALVAKTFSTEYRETPSGPNKRAELRHIFLIDPENRSAKPRQADLRVAGKDRGKRQFLFRNVERGRTYQLALPGHWSFHHGQQSLVDCTRADSTQHTNDLRVRFLFEG